MKTTSRRQFLKISALAGGALMVPWQVGARGHGRGGRSSSSGGGDLSPSSIPRFVTPLVDPTLPAAMPNSPGTPNFYNLAVRQVMRQVLPAGFPMTRLAVFGSVDDDRTFQYPAPAIEARVGTPTFVRWTNQQVNADGTFQEHVLKEAINPKLHWANPSGPPDSRGRGEVGSYRGPVPIVNHIHGGFVRPESDGHPFAWYLPNANNIPAGFSRQGTYYNPFKTAFETDNPALQWNPGDAIYRYDNDSDARYSGPTRPYQFPTALWIHDHTMGITELNVYAGGAMFYLLRGGPHDLTNGEIPVGFPYEIPLAITDRSFRRDGSLVFKEGDGNISLVNGKAYPFVNVEPRRYRLRILNASNNRIQSFSFGNVPAWQIGGDQGFLPAPVLLSKDKPLVLWNAERADVIVDFTGFANRRTYLRNTEGLAGDVLEFRVGSASGVVDPTTPADQLTLPTLPVTPGATNTRRVAVVGDLQGIVNVNGVPVLRGLEFDEPITETPTLAGGSVVENWDIYADDTHPIHLHQVHFTVVGRQRFNAATGQPVGAMRGPSPNERGPKDTVLCKEGEITRVRAEFRIPGEFVWHCHILLHEDHGMMRPFLVS